MLYTCIHACMYTILCFANPKVVSPSQRLVNKHNNNKYWSCFHWPVTLNIFEFDWFWQRTHQTFKFLLEQSTHATTDYSTNGAIWECVWKLIHPTFNSFSSSPQTQWTSNVIFSTFSTWLFKIALSFLPCFNWKCR